MNVRLALLVPIFAFGQWGIARAETPESKARTARMACLSGDYAKGVAILSELFVDTKSPTYIYNQGRCFEQNGRWVEAIARFEEYLHVDKNLSNSEKAETEERIAECKAGMARQAPPGPVGVQSAAPSAPPTGPTSPQTLPSAELRDERPIDRESASSAGPSLRAAGIITASVGGAALIAGLVFNLKANSLVHELQELDGYSSSKASDRNTDVTLGWIGYGAGAACITAGAILYYLGLRETSGPSSVALLPALAPGRLGALLTGAF